MLTKISKIFHTADIHCRTYKRHREYKIVIDRFLDYVSQNKDDESVIVIVGDVVHSKLEMSPELIDLVSYLFRRCAELCPTIGIPGNHDFNLNNKHRRDALSPIIDALNIPNIHYWKDSGVYRLGDIDFAVMSLRQEPSEWPTADQCTTPTKIAIYHGAVDGCKLDSDITYTSNTKLSIFQGFDIALLGDIHKRQQLSSHPVVCYPGSLIQQNFGESIEHGFLEWNVSNRSYNFVPIQNDWGYVTLEVQNGKLITDVDQFDRFKHIRARLKYDNTTAAELNEIVVALSKKFILSEVTYLRLNQFLIGDKPNNITSIFGNPREVQQQNLLITEYLKSQGVSDTDIENVIKLNINNPSQTQSSGVRFQVWKPKKFEFSNMFSYGEDNVVDFTNFQGIYGLFAPNASGKSALLDAFIYCLYDKSSRVSRAKHVLNNEKDKFYCKLNFELAGTDYFIERVATSNRSGDNVRVDVNFWRTDLDGTVISLNGKDRDDTNKAIRQYVGTYEDFVLTTFSTQNDNQSFVDKTQKERKELLYGFLDLSIFEDLHKAAREQARDLQAVQKELQKIDLINELASNEQQLQEYTDQLLQIEEIIKAHTEERAQYTDNVVSLTEQLIKLTTEIDIADVNRQLQLQNTNCEEIDRAILQQISNIQELTDKRQQLQSTSGTSSYEVQDLTHIQTQLNHIRGSISTLQSKLSAANAHIQGCNQKISNLDNHAYDPNCEFCVKNPFVLDAEQAKEKLPELLQAKEQVQQQITELELQLPELQVKEQTLKDYFTVQQQILTLSNEIENSTSKLKNSEQRKATILQNIAELEGKLKEYEENKKAIQHNSNIQSKISEVKAQIQKVEANLTQYQNQQSGLKASQQFTALKIEQLRESSIKVRELEQQTKAYEYYLQALSRDGVVYELLKKAIPTIENEVNDILSQLVDFKVKLEASEDTTINGYIAYDEDRFWPIELTSGMERFLLSIALRVAMINITSLPRANFLALDEGFGVLDGENLASISMLFDYLKNQFQFILCISHIDSMKDLTDKLITVEKDQQHSKVFVE